MIDRPTFIAADWGTTHLRLFLCNRSAVIERCSGPGIRHLHTNAEATLFESIEPWTRTHGPLPVLLAGMVGSRNGWREAPYASCPADIHALRRSMLRFNAREHEIAIVPGMSCTNPRGSPDVMRGEETQLVGAFDLDPSLARGRHVIALPGTHTKWALVEDGRIVTFQTSLSGELYALLRERSTLVSVAPAADDESIDDAAFERGLQRSRELATVPLTHLLFEVRARQLIDDWPRADALSFLSGLIIGQDVSGALELFERELVATGTVPLIGAPSLGALYARALSLHDIPARSLDGADLTLAGLRAIARIDPVRSH